MNFTQKPHSRVLAAVQTEIDLHKRAPLLCRIGFHQPSKWWSDFYAHVQVRKCRRCDCAVEARDSLRAANDDQREVIEYWKNYGKRMANEFHHGLAQHWPPAPHRPPPPPEARQSLNA